MTSMCGFVGRVDGALLRRMGRLLPQGGPDVHILQSDQAHFAMRASTDHGLERFDDRLVACSGHLLDAEGRPLSGYDVAEGYGRQGVQFFDGLDGHYSIAIWDASRRALVLARDPFGVMPLVFAQGENWTAFASHYKALLALPQISAAPDLLAINTFLYNGWAPPGRTFFKDLRQVLPGSVVLVGTSEPNIIRTKPRACDYEIPREPVTPNQVLETVERAVNAYAHDKTAKYGVSLSGGVDSALIAALLHKRLPRAQLCSFTVGHGESDPDIIGARQTSSILGISHREVIVRPMDLIELLPKTVWCLEDPGGYDEFPQLYALARAAAGKVDMLFSGNMCDTLFAGMPAHRRLWLGHHVPGAKKILNELRSAELSGTLPASWPARAVHYAIKGRHPLPAPCSAGPNQNGLATEEMAFADEDSPLFRMLGSALASWDNRMGAQQVLAAEFGLRSCMPYASKHLIDLALRIPDRQKVGPTQVKVILRKAAELILPRAITRRKKYIQQFKYDSEMADVMDHLHSRLFVPSRKAQSRIVNPAEVERLLRRGKRPYKPLEIRWLWNAITAEIWTQQFVDRRDEFLGDRSGHIGPISI
ncbi:Asparagine synthetase [glutamine-hydrolyzing] 1 [Bradyrhizobium ivorense]|uniref:asparagine synthase (glutamine-hydrolyzing) n=2 Tax=Bradyrhizobium ivorense TaxID=2511166 RepID=A0A508T9S7_9BRAD|nr:Asparagine synthetase [glutamine-hydrolyzing] 1 [Bradyrhizobium ivorense]